MICGINRYLTISIQSLNYVKSKHKDFGGENETFRKRYKSKISGADLENHYQKNVQRLQTLGILTTRYKTLTL
jgi:hypothetical protein